MTWFSKTAFKIRHSLPLKNSERLWNILRKPYHFLLDIRGNGVNLFIAGINVKVPAIFYSETLANYEKENTSFYISWIRENPNAYILDLGCSIGYFSTIALFVSETCTVIGFDSDIASLRASQRMSIYGSGDRLKLVYGLLSETSICGKTLEEAIEETEITIKNSNTTGRPGTTQYVNLDKNFGGQIPQHSIDELFSKTIAKTPVFIKCDIEGAELLALKGSQTFLRTYHPVILLSVHPSILPVFNGTVHQLHTYLKSEGYNIELISSDHEEHWWCYKTLEKQN